MYWGAQSSKVVNVYGIDWFDFSSYNYVTSAVNSVKDNMA